MLKQPFLKKIIQYAPVILFCIALFIIHKELETHEFSGLLKHWNNIPWSIALMACGLTLASYLFLTLYDVLALRSLGYRNIKYRYILFTSFVSFAISNNTGHAWASGGSIRYRFYQKMGVQGWDIAKISAFLSLTFFIGLMTLGLIAIVFAPANVLDHLNQLHLFYILILLSAGFLIMYWSIVFLIKKPIRIKNLNIDLPSPKTAFLQTLLACSDLILASTVLWILLKDIPGINFESFIVIFILAQLLGLVSQVPGGIGVFEGSFLWLSSNVLATSQPAIAIALVLYRVIYYFLPLFIAGTLLVLKDFYQHRSKLIQAEKLATRIIPSIVPQIFALFLFLSGAYLLVSGALPTLPNNLHWLSNFIPLPVLELSHLMGSLVGVLLLFLARGIYLKLDAAWYGALILLALAILSSVLTASGWVKVVALLIIFVCILISHRYFYRKSSLFELSPEPFWLISIVLVVAGSTWLGFFAYHHVIYSDDLWWQFSYKNDVSRFLRSSIVIAVLLVAIFIWQLFGISRPEHIEQLDESELNDIENILHQTHDTQGFLALLGDKKIFWSEDRSAFIAYATTKKYWIAMGDPVGTSSAFSELLWKFKEKADRFGAKIVFYQISEEYLPIYLDLGLSLLKLGQEARVELSQFGLEGKKRDNLRRGRNKLIKQNYYFEVLERDAVVANINRLKEISDAWLTQKQVREKRFSLGFFSEAYICRTRVAVARSPEGQIMAFANLWETFSHEELSIDLMRYDPLAPNGVMDFIFAELMLWGKTQQYVWFNLGVAPLSGLERHPLAPLWHKIGTTIFDLGEEFYNFEGLYEYKAKFNPVWQSRYLATPAGLSAPFTLLTITRLIAGGWKGIIKK